MIETMLTLNSWIALGVLIFEIAVLGKLISLIIMSLGDDNNFKKNFKETVYGTKQKIFHNFGWDVLSEKFLLVFIFLFSLLASILTLVYSEIFQQVPCALCWFERIFMYGIVVLSGIGLTKNPPLNQQKNIFVFSIFGAIISLYHHVLQMTAGIGSHLPCPTSGGDCAKRIIFEYGHITFPWMAFVMFAFFIIIILLQKRLKK
jgi:disulfide bond formation protein DsbB